MLLTEHEAKALLITQNISVPASTLLENVGRLPDFQKMGSVVKAQVLHGNRALLHLVQVTTTAEETLSECTKMFNATDYYGDPIEQVLIEEKITFSEEVYLSLSYDTHVRRLVCSYSSEGGVGMDNRGDSLEMVELSVLSEPTHFSPAPELLEIVQKLWRVFTQNDAVLVEINPLVQTRSGFVCLDAKIELEDAARFRHVDWKQVQRAAGEKKRTKLEQAALSISRSDHRGVAGESFFEFPGGTIGILASGGGASALVMDGLIQSGLNPANYTEYSGNPTAPKVQKLTELVAGIEGLEAILVVGSTANFTDIYETLSGVVAGLLSSKLSDQFPIVIRRGGPRWEEAFSFVRETLPQDRFMVSLLGPDVPILDSLSVLKVALAKRAKRTGKESH
ncbi:MAG: hypothetical protein GW762_04495 [Candidatus Pacebacteria bacterium]|nr:hypothetical protein [Candidatus Paceibacterota bacterium]PIR64009.1 MAG: hypothetical protein COU64_01140 [Candidatus Pacebacteria bacterium CG10_big_fil_rev_8_21_14_0_10_40_26]PIZ79629.1 MAG: hypothetical protein COY01_00715 [Candidatus Pacebacteria bacterium CG_4_10_14_0_2_um_filter_40_20]PJA69082.1 MAG: hypothetical protein CO156_01965 [Candidatus Pacebacteria bacterium CG_4_9_14_3_um_filter_40_12]PJC41784.1 MAG: hypothetical protein CO041_03640 [Candidatus Pacebacteria bacterium CG_4_9_